MYAQVLTDKLEKESLIFPPYFSRREQEREFAGARPGTRRG
jgi:hypothetical protein